MIDFAEAPTKVTKRLRRHDATRVVGDVQPVVAYLATCFLCLPPRGTALAKNEEAAATKLDEHVRRWHAPAAN